LIFVALISFAAMALLSLKIGFISIFVVYVFIFYGISTRYKYQAETQEWKRALHNFVDIEEMSGYPMGISFRKFILLVVLVLIAAFSLAVLISGSY
jgi:polyferredoxin